MAEPEKIEKAQVLKVDETLGLVFGWSIICKEDGADYYDLNVDREGAFKGERIPEHIPEDEMLRTCFEFAKAAERPGNEEHIGAAKGEHVFIFPMTTDIAAALEITTKRTGMLIAYHPPADVLAKFVSGELTGFSIEGFHQDSELLDVA